MVGEDVQDQHAPVDDGDIRLDGVLHVLDLGGGKLAVEDHEVGFQRGTEEGELPDLAAAEDGFDIGLFPALGDDGGDGAPGGIAEAFQLAEGDIAVLFAVLRENSAENSFFHGFFFHK